MLTEAGRIALDHAEAIFRTADDLTATLRETGRARRALRVGALATLSRNFQMQFLRPLIGRADVEVVLRSGSQAELLRGLEALALDVVLTNLRPGARRGQPLAGPPDRRAARQPDRHAGRVGAPIAPLAELLRDQPLILPTPETRSRAAFDALAARLGVTPLIAAEVDDMAMLRLLAREDAGLAVIPPIVVQDELRSGFLIEAARLDGISETLPRRDPATAFPQPIAIGCARPRCAHATV